MQMTREKVRMARCLYANNATTDGEKKSFVAQLTWQSIIKTKMQTHTGRDNSSLDGLYFTFLTWSLMYFVGNKRGLLFMERAVPCCGAAL